jgi:hypothetical protein
MQVQAAEFSGYAGKFRCFLERRVLKQFVFEICGRENLTSQSFDTSALLGTLQRFP